MPHSGLAALPYDVLHEICALLYGSHKPSLISLSLVNKQCCSTATAWQFRHLKIRVRGTQSLRRDLNDLSCMLKRRNAFLVVHHITISGYLVVSENEEDKPLKIEEGRNDLDLPDDDEVHGSYKYKCQPSRFLLPAPGTPEQMAPFWQPFVTIIEKTTCLRRLDYNCHNSLPLNLLRALEQHLPACRLHVENFRYWNFTENACNSSEMALTRSANLDSLHAEYVGDNAVEDDENREAMLHTIFGVSPNLRKISIDLHGDPVLWVSMVYGSREPMTALKEYSKNRGPVRATLLESFTIASSLQGAILPKLTEMIDFTNIRHLDLGHKVRSEPLRYILRNITFKRLQSLCVSLCWLADGPAGHIAERRLNMSDMYRNWFTNLPPLKSLVMSGCITSAVLNTVLTHHGSTLRSLRIYLFKDMHHPSGFDVEVFRQLRDTCHNLEDLKIPVLRSRGTGDEVLCYRLLSQCPSLRDLSIKIRCNPVPNVSPGDLTPVANFPDFDDEDMAICDDYSWPTRPRVGSIRHAMINCAVDEELARSIWNLIAGRKRGRPLQSLRINSNDAWDCRCGIADFIMYDMVRAFLLERSVRDDSDEVQIRDLGETKREAYLKRIREDENKTQKQPERTGRRDATKTMANEQRAAMMKIFRRVWPEQKEGSIDWRDDWHSFPLQIDESVEI